MDSHLAIPEVDVHDPCSSALSRWRFTTTLPSAAVHSGGLLCDDSLAAMRTPYAPVHSGDYERPPVAANGYGYGMFTGTFAGQAAYYHPGDNPGYQSFAGWLPGRAASIVVLANDESTSIEGQFKRLLPMALDVSG